VRLSQITKCMVGEATGGELIVMLLPGDQTLKLKKVGSYLGRRVDLIDRDVLAGTHGLMVGAISPIQLLGKNATFIADPTILDEEFVDISAGNPLLGVELGSVDLLGLLGSSLVEIRSTSAGSTEVLWPG
jgi:prolyl-tRNA editing enzyme YbaK/EbsC (Cys-tRNA(Pro) deacylase)